MKVVHIEDKVGSRGGEYWVLTLECGHFGFKYKPKFSLAAAMMPFISRDERTMRAIRERQLAQVRGAPRTFKCWHCEKRGAGEK